MPKFRIEWYDRVKMVAVIEAPDHAAVEALYESDPESVFNRGREEDTDRDWLEDIGIKQITE